jgi:putative transposase
MQKPGPTAQVQARFRIKALKARNNLAEGRMAQSLSSILIHMVFSTKNREPFITPDIESELYPYMAKIFRELKSPSLAIDGTSDHIHILFSLGRVITIADVVEEVKTNTSKWIKTKAPEFRNFHWQRGYGAFSIGQSNVAALKRYIRNQKEHHQRVTFQDEYRKVLKAYGIEFDERYVWD